MGERTTLKNDGNITPGYLARPTRPGPGILVIQEWWGPGGHPQKKPDLASLQAPVLGIYAGRPEVHAAAAAADAWAKTIGVFRREQQR